MKTGTIMRFFFITVFIFPLLSLSLASPSQAQLSNGDILVIDSSAGTGGDGALFSVDPTTGNRTVLSDFGNPAQGPTGVNPYAVAVESTGQILVVDYSAGTGFDGALFSVDPITGNRTLLSDFGNPAQGPTGVNPIALAIGSTGQIFVVDFDAGTGSLGALFRVDPTTGQRTVLSDFGNPGQGPLGMTPEGIAIESTGQILVVDEDAGTGALGGLFRVDPTTGQRTLLSDFGNAGQGPLGYAPTAVAIESAGQALVVDYNVGTSDLGELFRVDLATGDRTVVSDFGNPAQGPLGYMLADVTVESTGQVLAVDEDAGTGSLGALFRVDPTTGNRILLSDFGDGTQGPLGSDPAGVAIYQQQLTMIPTMNEWGMIIFMVLAGIGSVYYVRRLTQSKR